MTKSIYRKAMIQAFSFPVALFLVAPFVVVMLMAPWTIVNLLQALGILAALLVPLYVTGFLLAPWAGRRVETGKGAAFLMAAVAALSSALAVVGMAAASGGLALALGTAAIFAFFALPASMLGGLLFIGALSAPAIFRESASVMWH